MWSPSIQRRIYSLIMFAGSIFLMYKSFEFPWPRYMYICAFAAMFALFASGLALRVRWIYRVILLREGASLAANTVRLVRRLLGRPSRHRARRLLFSIAGSVGLIADLLSEDMSREFERRPEPTDTLVCLAVASVPLLIAALRTALAR